MASLKKLHRRRESLLPATAARSSPLEILYKGQDWVWWWRIIAILAALALSSR